MEMMLLRFYSGAVRTRTKAPDEVHAESQAPNWAAGWATGVRARDWERSGHRDQDGGVPVVPKCWPGSCLPQRVFESPVPPAQSDRPTKKPKQMLQVACILKATQNDHCSHSYLPLQPNELSPSLFTPPHHHKVTFSSSSLPILKK